MKSPLFHTSIFSFTFFTLTVCFFTMHSEGWCLNGAFFAWQDRNLQVFLCPFCIIKKSCTLVLGSFGQTNHELGFFLFHNLAWTSGYTLWAITPSTVTTFVRKKVSLCYQIFNTKLRSDWNLYFAIPLNARYVSQIGGNKWHDSVLWHWFFLAKIS